MKNWWSRLKKIDTNRSVAVAAVVISLCALVVSIMEVRIMRKQQRVTMYPYLSFSRSYSSEGFGLYLKNSGTGLAMVNSMQVTDGETYFSNWTEVVANFLPDSLVFGYDKIFTSNANGVMITPGESLRLFYVKWTPASRLLEERSRGLEVSLCYSSLLDETWRLVNEKAPESVRNCDAASGAVAFY